jgi:hypothetical protein
MLNRRPLRPPDEPFVDTPVGILSAGGVHFHTTQALLEAYAGPVLERAPLGVLIARAEVWLRGGQAVALWSLALLLLVVPPGVAAGMALTLYLAWETLSPAFVSRRIAAGLRVLERPLVQAVLFVAVLSVLGSGGALVAVGVGLVGFVGMRWGLVPWLLRPLVALLRRPLFTLPAPDQVLRAFVLRAALRHGVDLPQLDRLKRELRR